MSRHRAPALIIMPALNEEASIAAVIAEIRATVEVDIVVVNDGSTDATTTAARAAGATVLELPFNLGVGGAMRAGFKYAVRNGYDIVFQVDSDGQHDPRYIPDMIAALQHADIVIGARFAGEGEYHARGPRRWAMSLLASGISRVANTRLTDTTSGFKAMGPSALALFARQYPAEYLGDTIEALVDAARSGLRITQIPVAMRSRQGGVPSHDPVKSGVYLVRAVAALVVALARPVAHRELEAV